MLCIYFLLLLLEWGMLKLFSLLHYFRQLYKAYFEMS